MFIRVPVIKFKPMTVMFSFHEILGWKRNKCPAFFELILCEYSDLLRAWGALAQHSDPRPDPHHRQKAGGER